MFFKRKNSNQPEADINTSNLDLLFPNNSGMFSNIFAKGNSQFNLDINNKESTYSLFNDKDDEQEINTNNAALPIFCDESQENNTTLKNDPNEIFLNNKNYNSDNLSRNENYNLDLSPSNSNNYLRIKRKKSIDFLESMNKGIEEDSLNINLYKNLQKFTPKKQISLNETSKNSAAIVNTNYEPLNFDEEFKCPLDPFISQNNLISKSYIVNPLDINKIIQENLKMASKEISMSATNYDLRELRNIVNDPSKKSNLLKFSDEKSTKIISPSALDNKKIVLDKSKLENNFTVSDINSLPLNETDHSTFESINKEPKKKYKFQEYLDKLFKKKKPAKRFDKRNSYNPSNILFYLTKETQLLPKPEQRTKTPCFCKNTKCIKLYCDCFNNGKYCTDCDCVNCFNKVEYEEIRVKAMSQIAKKKKVKSLSDITNKEKVVNTRGCKCKNTKCLKNYCECYNLGQGCSKNCKCEGCKNDGEQAKNKRKSKQKKLSLSKKTSANLANQNKPIKSK